jgi:hypothetical protein
VTLVAVLLAVQLPDPTLTPGVVRPLSTAQVCGIKWGRDRRHVTSAMKVIVATSYRLKRSDVEPEGKGPCCEFDHLVPRELGGADDVKNLWPQPWAEAKTKDVLENWLHVQVCAGKMALADAQRTIATGWVAASQKAGLK